MSTKRKSPNSVASPNFFATAKTIEMPKINQRLRVPTKYRIDETRTAVSTAAGTLAPPSSNPTAGAPIEISSDSGSPRRLKKKLKDGEKEDEGDDDDDDDEDEDEEEGQDYEDMDEDVEGQEIPGGRERRGQLPEKKQTSTRRRTTPPPEDSTGDSVVEIDMSDPDQGRNQDTGSDNEGDEASAPTFGDLLRGSTTIDVSASLAAQAAQQQQQQGGSTPLSLAITSQQQQHQPQTVAVAATTTAPVSLSSLGTVLNQALRTDDSELLESCLHTTDLPTVRATISRMESGLAGTLLSKLASRMSRRPGRAHSLMTWVQWTLVAHGGTLASQPDLVKRLAELNRVLEERSRGLTSLLTLKGKLDMLDSQMQLRRESRPGKGKAGRKRSGVREDTEDTDEEGVVYVEGLEEAEEEESLPNGVATIEEEMVSHVNGVDGASESDEDEEDDDAEENSDEEDMDAEPDVADEESMDEDEVNFDDVEEEEDESGEDDDQDDDEDAAPAAKIQKIAAPTSRKRR